MMNDANHSPFARRFRLAGASLVLGLLIQALTLQWNHPLAFTIFLGPGFFFVGVGAAIFLWAVFEQSQIGWDRFNREGS